MRENEKKDIVIHQNKLSYGKFEEFELRELKLLLKLIAEYSKDPQPKVFLEAKDIKRFVNMERDNYSVFETLIRRLGKREILIKDPEKNRYVVYHIFSKLYFDLDNKVVELSYTPDFLPLISNLEKNFCKYDLENIEKLKSKYSVLFYIRAKAEMFKKKFYLSADELSSLYGKKYLEDRNLDKKVIFPMLKEINEHTDIVISTEKEYEAQQRGRSKVKGYIFKIDKKTLTVSPELEKAIAKAKRNIYIAKSKTLNDGTVQILLGSMNEAQLIAGLNRAYEVINKDFIALKYLQKVIEQAEVTEKNIKDSKVGEPTKKKKEKEIPKVSDEILAMEIEIISYAVNKMNIDKGFFETMKRNNNMLYKLTLAEYKKEMDQEKEKKEKSIDGTML
ncbi:MAG: replication initiation protein [Bacteroidales bacterium]|nr:replication initiation protein [Bacteroidales bacterium]